MIFHDIFKNIYLTVRDKDNKDRDRNRMRGKNGVKEIEEETVNVPSIGWFTSHRFAMTGFQAKARILELPVVYRVGERGQILEQTSAFFLGTYISREAE